MLRIVATIILPLLLPTALYLFWTLVVQRSQPGDPVPWAALPWTWLVGIGAALMVVVLSVVTVHYGTSEPGTYFPPRWENGKVIPGHVEPKR